VATLDGHPPATDPPAYAEATQPLSRVERESLVATAAAGEATDAELELLRADPDAWRETLLDLLAETDDALTKVRALTGPERDQVVADFESERASLSRALRRLTGEGDDPDDDPLAPGKIRLQLSWFGGRVVAWAAGDGTISGDADELADLLASTGAPPAGWTQHPPVPLSGGDKAFALSNDVVAVLGWLHALGAAPVAAREDEAVGDERALDTVDPSPAADEATAATGAGSGADPDDVGVSARWLGQVARWAVRLVAQGAVVPLVKARKRRRRNEDPVESYAVQWTPALVDEELLKTLVAGMPGAVGALDQNLDARAVTLSALGGMVDAMGREAARRVEVPAPPPAPRTAADVAEAFLGRLDGSPFEAPKGVARELVSDLDKWARPVTTVGAPRLVVQLDAPDEGNAWHLQILAPGRNGRLTSVDVAAVELGSRRRTIDDQVARLERLLPVLGRPGGDRLGEVVLSQVEAWDLMTDTGAMLRAAGFDVRVPVLSSRRSTPSLKLWADATEPSKVGANQLANVRWSVLFDDVELSAADITRLAREARPMVKSRGGWVALDKADLDEAAAALAERADTTQLSGAEMLRHALGLEGSPLRGGVSVEGNGWAAEVLSQAARVSEPAPTPDGFRGELRSYQSEAVAWLTFLDSAGLGGCLALDMGLGKTPTMLAHLLATSGNGPALVVAPPAVVGNWAAESARFTPDLRVVVHHGATRASAEEIAKEAADADVVITTYGTAVRDVDALEAVEWDRVILDEAQAIKNPANFTAQQLRRLPARVKVALTGTPVENGLGDLWAILDYTNPGLVGQRPAFIAQLSRGSENGGAPTERALRALNGILVFRRTKAEPAIAAELPDRIDELDHCTMSKEQIGLYQAVLDRLIVSPDDEGSEPRKGAVLAAITALKQICNHPAAYQDDGGDLSGRSGKLARLEEIVDQVFAADERVLIFTHFAQWGERLAEHLTKRTGTAVDCYHGGLSRTARDKMIAEFQARTGPGALVLSLKAGGTGLNLTNANHVVLYDRWWNPAVEDQARDRAWRIGQKHTVISHRLVCPGTVDERVEEVVAGKRRIAELVLPKSSSLADLDADQLRTALGLRADQVLTEDDEDGATHGNAGTEGDA
jgi:superfamily II DNA or RNA helicase